jgi:3-keto-5-aminohexanoate cleavage enzyme
MSDKVNWKLVNEMFETKGKVAGGELYGYPEFIDPLKSVFVPGVELQPKWDVPEKVAICTAITGAFHSKATNPYHPITVEEIKKEAMETCEARAANVHIHVRDDNGMNTLDVDRFHEVIDPLKEKYPGVVICGCVVPWADGDFVRMERAFKENLFDQTPVCPTTTYVGDTLYYKQPYLMIKKAELCEKYDVKPQIAIYVDGDIDNARRYLIESGVLRKPYYWILLPGLVGCSPMYSPLSMTDTLVNQVRRIREVDADSRIMVCASGRASSYLTTLALLLGLEIRVGKEDSIWKYPHKDDNIESNAQIYKNTVALARLLGREPATRKEYVERFGLRRQGGKLLKK